MSAARPVLLVSNHGEIVGGGEISLLGLLEGMDRARWAPVLAVPEEGPVAARARALGIPAHVVPLPGVRRPWGGVIRGVAALHRLARGCGARLLHANGTRAMVYAGPAGRLSGRPVIWHVRVADPEPALDRILTALARAVVVNSDAVARRFPWARPGKVRRIHNGVDLSRFSPRQPPAALRGALGIPEDVPVAASVGRFVAYKGYDHLLDTARLVRDARPDVHWILVGDGELRDALEARRRDLALADRVRFTGWREDVPDLLALCAVFVLPSLGEHFGRVLVEAMAMGRPVVATDAGGVPEIVLPGETGLLVPPAQPKALAEAVLALLDDPARAAALGAAGRRRAETEFSLARHAAAVEALYGEILGDARAGV